MKLDFSTCSSRMFYIILQNINDHNFYPQSLGKHHVYIIFLLKYNVHEISARQSHCMERIYTSWYFITNLLLSFLRNYFFSFSYSSQNKQISKFFVWKIKNLNGCVTKTYITLISKVKMTKKWFVSIQIKALCPNKRRISCFSSICNFIFKTI